MHLFDIVTKMIKFSTPDHIIDCDIRIYYIIGQDEFLDQYEGLSKLHNSISYLEETLVPVLGVNQHIVRLDDGEAADDS